LTVLGTVLLGKKLWQGWVVAAINSAVVCVIGVRTAQFGFVPANLVCIALYTSNLFTWRLRPGLIVTRRALRPNPSFSSNDLRLRELHSHHLSPPNHRMQPRIE